MSRTSRPLSPIGYLAVVALMNSSCSSESGSKDDGTNLQTMTGADSASGGQNPDHYGRENSGGGAAESAGGLGSGGLSATGGLSAQAGGAPSSSGGLGSGGLGEDSGGTSNSGGDTGACMPDPNCQPSAPDTGDFFEDCVARVNQFRACMCLPPLARNTEGEECANQQAQYDYENDTYHGGIRNEICSPKELNNAAQNECPGYPSVASTIGLCHQQMFDEGQCDDFNTCGHYLNITNDRSASVSCGYYETPEGDVWMVQNFYF